MSSSFLSRYSSPLSGLLLLLPWTQPLCQRRHLQVGKVLYIGGRDANSEDIGCEDAGVDTALHGCIEASGLVPPCHN